MFNEREGSGFSLFSIGKVKVSLSMSFFFVAAFILFTGNLARGLAFIIALLLSVLIHEYGHAIPCLKWKLSPSILLHGFGGLCFHQPADSDNKDVVIVVAGPLLEIVVGFLAYGVMILNGNYGWVTHPFALNLLQFFAYISVIWGAINLFIPLYPLDGGTLMLLILRRFTSEKKARDLTLKISIGVGIPLLLLAFYASSWFIGIYIGYIVYENFTMLKNGQKLIYRPSGRVSKSVFVKDRLHEIEVAFSNEDYSEACRLSHVLRSSNDQVPPKNMNRIYEILVLANLKKGDMDEAKMWLGKAPDTAAIREAEKQLD